MTFGKKVMNVLFISLNALIVFFPHYDLHADAKSVTTSVYDEQYDDIYDEAKKHANAAALYEEEMESGGSAANEADRTGFAAFEAKHRETAFTVSEADDAAFAWLDDYEQLKSGQKIMKERDYHVPEQPTVYLSFDDGPSKVTEQVLDILKKEGVPATFFVLGQAAEANPQIVQRIVKEGHAIGNHTYNHKYEELYQDFAGYWKQIRQTERILQQVAGISPKIVRTPGGSHGHLDPFYIYLMDQAGYQIYDWNVDSGDARRPGVTAEEMIANVKSAPLKHEMHVLMHDSSRREETVKALPEIIAYFRRCGYQFAVITEKTKPVMQSLGKLRHSRETSPERFRHLLSMVHEDALLANHDSANMNKEVWPVLGNEAALVLGSGKISAVGNEAVSVPGEANVRVLSADKQDAKTVQKEAADERLKQVLPPLSIELPGAAVRFAADDYELWNGRLYVPARRLHEMTGAKIFWKEKEKKAVVQMGLRFIEYDVTGRTMTMPALGSGKPASIVSMPLMHVKDGMLMVPLREWANQMNAAIDEVEMNPTHYRVNLSYPELVFYV